MNLEEDGPRMDVEAPRQTIAFETEAIAPRCWISFLIRRGKNTSSVVEAILRKLKERESIRLPEIQKQKADAEVCCTSEEGKGKFFSKKCHLQLENILFSLELFADFPSYN